MITGRGSGSGKYSYQETSAGNISVRVSHMPEDTHYSVRISFEHSGETSIPIVKTDTTSARLLWCSINRMARDLNWDDRMEHEIIKEGLNK